MDIQSLFSCIDLTSLSLFDNQETIQRLIQSALALEKENYPVASICTYPKYAEFVSKELLHSNIKTCVVNSSFPHAQSSLKSKLNDIDEIKRHVEEVDIVMDLGQFLLEKPLVDPQIKAIKKKLEEKTVKVILETGEIKDEKLLRQVCRCALQSGADFIKTSTGKTAIGATPEAVSIMAEEIANFEIKERKTVGLKISGGIRNFKTVQHYISIVEEHLPPTYLNNQTFRIGASSLINDLKKYR